MRAAEPEREREGEDEENGGAVGCNCGMSFGALRGGRRGER